jgi:hypothetical protein
MGMEKTKEAIMADKKLFKEIEKVTMKLLKERTSR